MEGIAERKAIISWLREQAAIAKEISDRVEDYDMGDKDEYWMGRWIVLEQVADALEAGRHTSQFRQEISSSDS